LLFLKPKTIEVKIKLIGLVIFLGYFGLHAQTLITIEGKVTDTSGKPLESVSVAVKNTIFGTATNANGYYRMQVPARKNMQLAASSIGYETKIAMLPETNGLNENSVLTVDIVLENKVTGIGEIIISDKQLNPGTHRIVPKGLRVLPGGMSAELQNLLKTMPGVSVNNEFSSQYSVRGGNYDENLIYVNDIEIHRPLSIRSGYQEGLSFINLNMVSGINFSSGGFEAKYGDKLASVLDVSYFKPKEKLLKTSIGLTGASVHGEYSGKNNRWSYIGGMRYKTTKVLLAGLDISGDYNPVFLDYQSLLSFKINANFNVQYLANVVSNTFNFVPEQQNTAYGALGNSDLAQSLEFNTYFEGKENDSFSGATNALTFNYDKNETLHKFIFSNYTGYEKERFDIAGAYYLNELEKDLSKENAGDSILNIGIGAYLHHARNYLNQQISTAAYKGNLSKSLLSMWWGAEFRTEKITEQLSEWKMIDSLGYSIPYSGQNITLAEYTVANNSLSNNRISVYWQASYLFHNLSGKFRFTGGLRGFINQLTSERYLTPRFSVSFTPEAANNTTWRLALGQYIQPPYYKEFKLFNGALYLSQLSQKSWHAVVSNETNFMMWNRNFKFIGELYFKYFSRIIPFEQENVRINYYAEQTAIGYAAGADFKVYGEFVEGVDSWFSLSLLKTMEDIDNDKLGYIARPTDRRLNVGVFFQDYLPGNKTFRFSFTAVYGSSTPYGPPKTGRAEAVFTLPAYKRIDLGFSKEFNAKENSWYRKLGIKGGQLSLEVFNMFKFKNTISYSWLRVVPNSALPQFGDTYQFPVPNRLSDRRIGLNLNLDF